MPKVTRRSQRYIPSNTASMSSTMRTRGRETHNSQYEKLTVECGKYTMLYEHHQIHNNSRNYRLHISKRGALGPSSAVPNIQQHEKGQATTVVINNDHAGITLDVSLRKNDTNSFNIIITNSDD